MGKMVSMVPIRLRLALAQVTQSLRNPVGHVVAPGGRAVYYIMSLPGKDADGNPNRQIEVGRKGNSSFEVLLKPEPSNDPRENLTGFSHLFRLTDGRTLYFQAWAWATSNAVHSLDIQTKHVSYVTNGQIACVVLQGEYEGVDGAGTQHAGWGRCKRDR